MPKKKIKRPRLSEEQYNGIKKMLDGSFDIEEISKISGRCKATLYKIKSSSDFQDYLEKQRFYHRNEKKTTSVDAGGSGICITITVEDITYLSDESINVILKALQAVFGTSKVYMTYSDLGSSITIKEGE